MLVEISCGVCGFHFGLEDHKLTKLQQTGDTFWCPKGCCISYTPSENSKLKDRIKALEIQLDKANQRVIDKNNTIFYWSTENEKLTKQLRYVTGVKTRFQNKLRLLTIECGKTK